MLTLDYDLEFADHTKLAPLSNVELSVNKFKGEGNENIKCLKIIFQ